MQLARTGERTFKCKKAFLDPADCQLPAKNVISWRDTLVLEAATELTISRRTLQCLTAIYDYEQLPDTSAMQISKLAKVDSASNDKGSLREPE